jgi:hypothetical protein
MNRASIRGTIRVSREKPVRFITTVIVCPTGKALQMFKSLKRLAGAGASDAGG